MHSRTVLILSAGLNLALGAGWYHASRTQPVVIKADQPETSAPGTNALPRPRVNVVTRTAIITWKAVESGDYVEYIRNLRAINFPEQTIRDIIVADVNQMFARRRILEGISWDQKWWKTGGADEGLQGGDPPRDRRMGQFSPSGEMGPVRLGPPACCDAVTGQQIEQSVPSGFGPGPLGEVGDIGAVGPARVGAPPADQAVEGLKGGVDREPHRERQPSQRLRTAAARFLSDLR